MDVSCLFWFYIFFRINFENSKNSWLFIKILLPSPIFFVDRKLTLLDRTLFLKSLCSGLAGQMNWIFVPLDFYLSYNRVRSTQTQLPICCFFQIYCAIDNKLLKPAQSLLQNLKFFFLLFDSLLLFLLQMGYKSLMRVVYHYIFLTN